MRLMFLTRGHWVREIMWDGRVIRIGGVGVLMGVKINVVKEVVSDEEVSWGLSLNIVEGTEVVSRNCQKEIPKGI